MTDDTWNNFVKTVNAWQKANKGWDDESHANYSEDLDSLKRLLKKGADNEDRRSRIITTIFTLFSDIETNPFDGFEIPFPWCHSCGELIILEEGIIFRDEKICGDCSSIACEHCNKTYPELEVTEISDCGACSDSTCSECNTVCKECSTAYCPNCVDDGRFIGDTRWVCECFV